jgi:hypothetical protein
LARDHQRSLDFGIGGGWCTFRIQFDPISIYGSA